MKWADLTDALFCRAYGHFFAITKPAFRNDVVKWSVMDEDGNYVDKGGTVTITAAKAKCKALFQELKANDKSIYIKNNGKLTRKKYERIEVG